MINFAAPGGHAPESPFLPPVLEWRDVSLDLGEFSVDDVSLRLDAGTWMCIVGSTGAGKTLLLEVAAGFLAPTKGRVFRSGQEITTAPPERRRLAYVPQDDLLFPHLDVRTNLLFGVRRQTGATSRCLDSITRDLGIHHLLGRRIDAISGGEAQRVALGRALLLDLDVLLLDECTSALDEETREIVGGFLAKQCAQRHLSVVQVTHDSAEARRLADVIITMDKGRVIHRTLRSGAPENGAHSQAQLRRRGDEMAPRISRSETPEASRVAQRAFELENQEAAHESQSRTDQTAGRNGRLSGRKPRGGGVLHARTGFVHADP